MYIINAPPTGARQKNSEVLFNMKRMTNRLTGLLLATAMLFGLFAGMQPAAGAAGAGKAIRLVSSTDPAGGISSDDYIYFGTESVSDTGFDARWRVLNSALASTGDAGMLLLSDKLIGNAQSAQGGVYFNAADSADPNRWQGSAAQAWCGDFLTSSFSAAEQNAIVATFKSDGKYEYTDPVYGTVSSFAASDGILNGDKLFFLSAEEADSVEFGLSLASSRVAYFGSKAGAWWLRSAALPSGVGRVSAAGSIQPWTPTDEVAARPAFNLDRQAVLFTSPAVGGKPSGMGFFPVADASPNEWKLTLLDSSRSRFSAEYNEPTNGALHDSGIITITYVGAPAGTNEYISAIITNAAGDVTYYGKLAQSGSSNNRVSFDLSGKYFEGDTLYVFSEQANGDKCTDYASELVEIELPELPPDKIYHTVSFNSRGGSDVPAQRVEDGKKAANPTNPVRDGWTFKEWCSDPECTRKYNFNAAVTSDIMLYAKWRLAYRAYTYDASSGTSRQGGVIVLDGFANKFLDGSIGEDKIGAEAPEVTLEARADAGYRFKEWRMGINTGEDLSYEIICTLEILSTENICTFAITNGLSLYAIFEENPIPELGLADETNAPFTLGKALRWVGMDAENTGEPDDYGYDPSQTSITLNALDCGMPMTYSDDAAEIVMNMLADSDYAEYARYTANGFAELIAETDSATGDLKVGYVNNVNGIDTFVPMLYIAAQEGENGGMQLKLTSHAPGCVRITLKGAYGKEYAMITPGDVNLDGKMNSNDWITIMRLTLSAIGEADVIDYPEFELNGSRDYDLWALLADMTAVDISTDRDQLVNAVDWITIMRLTLQAWKE